MDKNKQSSSINNVTRKPSASTATKSSKRPLGKASQTSSVEPRPTWWVRYQPKKENWFYWLGGVLILVFGIAIIWYIGVPGVIGSASEVKIDPNLERYDVPVDGYPSIGPADAQITLVEFSDYQCPFCEKWYQEVYSRLQNDYAGKIRIVYRDFPLYAIHPDSESAAEAAHCAGEQQAYWTYHDALFGGKYGLGASAYEKYATDLGLKLDQFKECISTRRFKSKVDANVKFASNLGVSSTPTFFLNGMAIVGAQPYDVFKQIIDKELAGEIKK